MRGIKRKYVFAVRRPDGKFMGEKKNVWTIDENEAYLFASEAPAKLVASIMNYTFSVDCTAVRLHSRNQSDSIASCN